MQEISSRPSVVILSAGSSKDKMPGFPIFKESPAFLPVNSRSLGKLVVDFYIKEAADKIYLVVNRDDFQTASEEFGCFGDKLKLIPVTDSHSVVDTLEQALPQVESEDIIVNIVTSIPNLLIPAINFIGINQEPTQIEGWSGLKINEGDLSFMTKKESYGQTGHSFSGIFRANRTKVLQVAREIRGEFRKDLISVVAALHKMEPVQVVHFSWFDCGHVQNYFKTRSKIFGSRFFNSISLDTTSGILTKKSSNREKLLRETQYIEKLPRELSAYFPRVFNVFEGNGKQDVKVEMEYYAYPTLAEVMLYWNVPISMWLGIFENLSSTLSKFSSYQGAYQKNDWFEIYVTKVLDRVSAFERSLADGERSLLFSESPIRINGIAHLPWSKLRDVLTQVFPVIESSNDCAVIHGDYCFNNILCEPYVGLLKLLDPRGSFGESLVGIYGDRKYDWAKWGHSVVGRYDYIVNDLFSVRIDSGEFHLTTYDRPWQADLDKLYWSCLEKGGLDAGVISFIIGTLFISMPPLHADSRARQTAFFLKGIEFLNKGWNQLSSSEKI